MNGVDVADFVIVIALGVIITALMWTSTFIMSHWAVVLFIATVIFAIALIRYCVQRIAVLDK